MNKLNKLMIITIAGVITCGQHTYTNTTKVVVATVAAAQAATQTLEFKILKCAESHLHHFQDLSVFNISSKLGHIEKLRKELLHLVEKAENSERAQYKQLEAILRNFDIKQIKKAIDDFKQILKNLPKDTSKLIKDNIKDPVVNRVLNA